MYASVRRYELGAGSRGAGAVTVLVNRIEEGLAPTLAGLPGFIASYVLDTGDGVVAVVNIFENRQGVEEAGRVTQEWGKLNLRNLLQQAPQVTSGEVRVHRP